MGTKSLRKLFQVFQVFQALHTRIVWSLDSKVSGEIPHLFVASLKFHVKLILYLVWAKIDFQSFAHNQKAVTVKARLKFNVKLILYVKETTQTRDALSFAHGVNATENHTCAQGEGVRGSVHSCYPTNL